MFYQKKYRNSIGTAIKIKNKQTPSDYNDKKRKINSGAQMNSSTPSCLSAFIVTGQFKLLWFCFGDSQF